MFSKKIMRINDDDDDDDDELVCVEAGRRRDDEVGGFHGVAVSARQRHRTAGDSYTDDPRRPSPADDAVRHHQAQARLRQRRLAGTGAGEATSHCQETPYSVAMTDPRAPAATDNVTYQNLKRPARNQ